jgi:biofilm PGA synthesis N-glycosyltransferase PgaC
MLPHLSELPEHVLGVTALIPAYNEAESISATIRSLQAQTCPLFEIIVIDDCSTDDTGDIARALGVTVLRPPQNTGASTCGHPEAGPP